MDGPQHYDRFVAPFIEPYTAATISAIPLEATRLLDHGAGTGAVTCALLRQRANRSVTALDPSAEMLARLPDKLDDAARVRVTRIVGTIADVGPEILFDAITSQIALTFCPDIPGELVALRTHADADANLVIACLGPPETVAAFTHYWEAARRVHPELAPAADYPHFRTSNPGHLTITLTEAGWNVDGVDAVESWRVVTPDELWTWVSRALPLRRMDGTVLGGDSDVKWDAIRSELEADLAGRESADGFLTLPMHGWLVRAYNGRCAV